MNSTGATIDLSSPLPRVIAQKAGRDALEQACKPLRPLAPNMVKMTEGFDIASCKKIFHCNCPLLKDDNDHTVRLKIVHSNINIHEMITHGW